MAREPFLSSLLCQCCAPSQLSLADLRPANERAKSPLRSISRAEVATVLEFGAKRLFLVDEERAPLHSMPRAVNIKPYTEHRATQLIPKTSSFFAFFFS